MENEINYYKRNKLIILSKIKNKTPEEKEKIREYNRNYYNNVRKNNIDYLNKKKEFNDYHNNRRRNLNNQLINLNNEFKLTINKKKVSEIIINPFSVIIQEGKFVLEF